MKTFKITFTVDSQEYAEPLVVEKEYPIDLPNLDEFLSEVTLDRIINEFVVSPLKQLKKEIISKDLDKFPEIKEALQDKM